MMQRVLLVGEASGVHRNIAKGLRELGIDVLHMVQSDAPNWNASWQRYDGAFAADRPGVRGGIARNLAPFTKIMQLGRFDVINMTNTITAVPGLYTRYRELPLLRRRTRLLAYYALACDEISLIRRNPVLPYTPCAGCLRDDAVLGNDCERVLNPRWARSNADVRRHYDFGASAMIEYDHSADQFASGMFARIGLPLDAGPIAFTPAKPSARPLIVHTPTRRGFKGTEIVLAAIDLLAQRRSDFRFEIVEGLAYDAYLARIAEADIIVDQVFSQSPGMNGLAMMAAGKIVFTGATDLGRSFLPAMARMPAFDASPDPAVLARALENVLSSKEQFPALAEAGRSYVLAHHDVGAISRQFIAAWTRALACKERRDVPCPTKQVS